MVLSGEQLTFSGSLLKRGFWIYLWRVHIGKRILIYVGRTGDSSSRYASSPFNRLGMHLDLRQTAKGNSLVRLLKESGINPMSCTFEMFAIGPLFKEQHSFAAHKPYRNRVALLEAELASYLKDNGYFVLGKHPKPGKYDKRVFSKIRKEVDRFLSRSSCRYAT
jgi:hypothetical protein